MGLADGADEVVFVNPRDVLAAVAVGAAEAAADESHEDFKPSVGFVFPFLGDVGAEVVLAGAENAGGDGVAGGRRRSRRSIWSQKLSRIGADADSLADSVRGRETGVVDLFAILGR